MPLDAPAYDAFAVTPNDATVQAAESLYVGGAGDVAVETEAGNAVTFKDVTAGAVLPIRVNRVLATGTTATEILGLRKL